MNLSSGQLSVILIVSLALCGFSYWWYKNQQQALTQQQALAQIEDAYSRQFCGVVFPNLKNCVTASNEECPAIAQTAVRSCLDGIKNYLPQLISKDELKETHERVADCFALNMHEQIMSKYLIKSEACLSLMR